MFLSHLRDPWYERHDQWQKVCFCCMFVFILPVFKHLDFPLFTFTKPTQKLPVLSDPWITEPSRNTSLRFTYSCINKHMQELHRHRNNYRVMFYQKNVETAILHPFLHRRGEFRGKNPIYFLGKLIYNIIITMYEPFTVKHSLPAISSEDVMHWCKHL